MVLHVAIRLGCRNGQGPARGVAINRLGLSGRQATAVQMLMEFDDLIDGKIQLIAVDDQLVHGLDIDAHQIPDRQPRGDDNVQVLRGRFDQEANELGRRPLALEFVNVIQNQMDVPLANLFQCVEKQIDRCGQIACRNFAPFQHALQRLTTITREGLPTTTIQAGQK